MGVHVTQRDFNTSDFNIATNGEITLAGTGGGGSATGFTPVNNNITTNAAADINIFGIFDTTSSWTITIATADVVAGKIFIFRDESGGAGTSFITISTEGSELIDGVNSVDINQDNGVLRLYSDGTDLYSW